jgi:hypothetical protein
MGWPNRFGELLPGAREDQPEKKLVAAPPPSGRRYALFLVPGTVRMIVE